MRKSLFTACDFSGVFRIIFRDDFWSNQPFRNEFGRADKAERVRHRRHALEKDANAPFRSGKIAG